MIPTVVAQEIARIAGIAMVGVSGIAALTLIVCVQIWKKSKQEEE